MGWEQPHAQHPFRKTGVSLLVCVIFFDLSGMGGPTSSYTTASLASRNTSPRQDPPLGQQRRGHLVKYKTYDPYSTETQ
jgi:hypothetical protein